MCALRLGVLGAPAHPQPRYGIARAAKHQSNKNHAIKFHVFAKKYPKRGLLTRQGWLTHRKVSHGY
jgi:hypothetical protein